MQPYCLKRQNHVFYLMSVKIKISPTFAKMVMLYKQCIKEYGSNYRIQKEISSGRLFLLEKGVYSKDKHESGIAIVAAKYPKAVFSMDFAFYHYNLTDTIPDNYCLVTERHARKISDAHVVQRFENSDILHLGAMQEKIDNANITIYNRERMLLELLRNKNVLPFDYYKEIIENYRKIIYDLDIRLIQDYIPLMPKSKMIFRALQLEVL